MRAGKDQHVAAGGPDPLDHPVGASADGGRVLAAGTTVAEQVPVGTITVNIVGFYPLVLAVIPFDRIRHDLGLVAEPSQLAGAASALQRAGENLDEAEPFETAGQLAGVALAMRGQRNVGYAGMLAGQAPLGLAVP